MAATESQDPEALAAEREIEKLKAEQSRLLAQLKRELASLPARSDPDRRAKLTLLLSEVEKRIAADPAARTRYLTPKKASAEEPAIRAYYERVRDRIEKQANIEFPKADGVSLYGQVIVTFTLTSAGKIERIQVAKTSSDALSRHSVKLLQQLEPFEDFPAEVAKSVDRMVITAPFSYTNSAQPLGL